MHRFGTNGDRKSRFTGLVKWCVMYCMRKALSRWLLDTREMCLPRSLSNSRPALLIGPRVSTATGMKAYDCASCLYLVIFLSAAAPDDPDVTGK